ncbi:hypothetical protein BJV74DRAFT_467136 [Russula compacta]|nr:hypothetical protein BJV74DRAFT_467136 [Russula compacta]
MGGEADTVLRLWRSAPRPHARRQADALPRFSCMLGRECGIARTMGRRATRQAMAGWLADGRTVEKKAGNSPSPLPRGSALRYGSS